MRLTRDDIIAGLTDLARRCSTVGIEVGIHIVGGAAIALEYEPSREATRDINAWTNVNHDRRHDFDEAVALVAQQHRWPNDWINDAAVMFIPESVSPTDWRPILEIGTVSVYVASPEVMLVMKLRAGRGRRDLPDLEPLIIASGTMSLPDALALYDRFYPDDPMRPLSRTWLEEYYRGDHPLQPTTGLNP